MSLQVLTIDTLQTANSFKSECDLAPLGLPALNNLINYLCGVSGGNKPAKLTINVGAVKASGLITSTGIAVNNQTMTCAGQTITAKTSGAVAADGEFDISATVATQAANIAAAINAVAVLQGVVSAVAVLGVVTVSAVVPGLIGNGLVMVDVDLANVTVSDITGGLNGTEYTIVNQIS